MKITKKQAEKMVAMYAEGRSAADIGKTFGVQPVTVSRWLRWAGVEMRYDTTPKTARNAEITAAVVGGETLEAVAARYGITRERVRVITDRESGVKGFARKRQRHTKAERLAAVRELASQGLWSSAIAARLGCSETSVFLAARELGTALPQNPDTRAEFYKHEAQIRRWHAEGVTWPELVGRVYPSAGKGWRTQAARIKKVFGLPSRKPGRLASEARK